MMNLTYKIEFYSNWQCSSGQAAGADVDELAIKDSRGLPYIPGRTIKGLLKDACNELNKYGELSKEDIDKVFGFFDDKDNVVKGCAFFSNATLPDGDAIAGAKLTDGLFQSVSATAIGDDGIAKEHSLRKVQTVVPCSLRGEIHNVPDNFALSMEKAMKLIKRLGTGRNHGFGRCNITINKEERL